MPPADPSLQNTYSQSSSKIKGIDFEKLWIKNGHPLMVTAKGAASSTNGWPGSTCDKDRKKEMINSNKVTCIW